jgi:hypothetical protein
MTTTPSDFSWLPDRHLSAPATLGHVDSIIEAAGELLRDYSRVGPLVLGSRIEGHIEHVVVERVRPIPAAVPRLAADALTQLRAALEHAVFTEVEFLLGRPLTDQEERVVELPVHDEEAKFDKWALDPRRRNLTPLRPGGVLYDRIRELQPFTSPNPRQHPLRLLAAHTNLAKHRTPVIAQTHLGAVVPDIPTPGFVVPQPGAGPLLGGEIIASGSRGTPVAMDVWATTLIRRPHTGDWNVLMIELDRIEVWVRENGLPTLISGTTDVHPLPPALDPARGYDDVRSALQDAEKPRAFIRNKDALAAEGVIRPGLIEILCDRKSPAERIAIMWWVSQLTDRQVIERHSRLIKTSSSPHLWAEAERQLVGIAVRAYSNRPKPTTSTGPNSAF